MKFHGISSFCITMAPQWYHDGIIITYEKILVKWLTRELKNGIIEKICDACDTREGGFG